MYKVKCCKQWRHVKFKGTMTKQTVPKPTNRTAQKHAEHEDATDIKTNNLILCFFGICYNKFFDVWFLKWFLGTVNDFHWGLISVLRYSNPHTLSTCFEEEKRKTNNTILPIHGIVRKWNY